MPRPSLRRLVGHQRTRRANPQLGLLLAGVAGAINAGGFLAIQRYTSHMTGIVSGIADDLASSADGDGVVVTDATGLQPLLGLWRTAALREHAGAMLDAGESAARRLVARLRVSRLDLAPRRLDNLNTPHDFPEGYDP